jgi:hypothetical protein
MELSEIFLTNPLKLQLTEARMQSTRLAMHITGLNWKNAIEQMDEFETEQKKNLRQKYSRSNRDIFTKLHRPIDKVFSAAGGSVTINIPESKQKEFNAYLGNIRKSMSLRKWVQQIALSGYHIDPNGLIFIEVDKDGKPYPTYKSTDDIFYYETSGRNVSLVIFNLSIQQANQFGLAAPGVSMILDRIKNKDQKTRFYRVVDAVSDKIVEWNGATLVEIEDLNLPNPFMVCPAMIISDIYQFNSDLLLSPDSEVVELANALLTQNSVFEIWKNLHMFPKHWRMQSVCPTCQGAGTVNGNTCIDCNGTKFQKRSSVRDEIIVPFPDSTDGKISLPQAFDGYSSPMTEPWRLATDDIDRLYQQMFETKWGYSPNSSKPQVQVKGDNKTATQVLDEGNAKIQRLYSYSEWAETIEKFIIDLCAGLMYGTAYKGCSVNYGDRYIMEGPDEIWLKYSDARGKGVAQAILDSLLLDYYEAKYYGNPIALQVALKQMRVEPWVHLTIREAQGLSATDQDKACKTYFSEWASTLMPMDWIQGTDETLRLQLITYVTPKITTIQKEVADAALQAAFEPPAAKPALSKPIV